VSLKRKSERILTAKVIKLADVHRDRQWLITATVARDVILSKRLDNKDVLTALGAFFDKFNLAICIILKAEFNHNLKDIIPPLADEDRRFIVNRV
jgi:hypothetical protein